jgi:hypothetical protein
LVELAEGAHGYGELPSAIHGNVVAPETPWPVANEAWFSSGSGWVAIGYGCKPHAPRLSHGQKNQRPTLCGIVAIELGSALQATA